MPETRDLLAELAADEAQERQAADAEHEANQEAQRAADAETLAARNAGEAPEGEEPEGEPEGDGEGEEPRLYAGKYQSVEEMERAYLEAQSTIGRLGNEVGQIRKMVEQNQGGGGQPAPAQGQLGPDGAPLMSKEEMDEWMIEDPVQATFYLSQLAARAVAEEQNQRFEPMIQTVNNNAAAAALEQVKRELGPDGEQLLADHREALIAAMEADRGHFVDPQTRVRHMRQAIRDAAWESGYRPSEPEPSTNGRRTRRPATEDVHVEGGSGAAPLTRGGREPKLSPEEEELATLTTWRPPVDEMGIPLPRGPLG